MPEKRLARVERELHAIQSIDTIANNMEGQLRGYSMMLGRSGEDARYRKLAKLRRAEITATLSKMQELLREVRVRGNTALELHESAENAKRSLGPSKKVLLDDYILPRITLAYAKFQKLKHAWVLNNHAELKETLTKGGGLPPQVEFLPEDMGAFVRNRGEIEIYVSSIRGDVLSSAQKKKLRERLLSTLLKHGEVICVDPFARHSRFMMVTPKLPQTYALNKRFYAEKYDDYAMGAAAARQGRLVFNEKLLDVNAVRSQALEGHAARTVPFQTRDVIAHEKGHSKNEELFTELWRAAEHRHHGDAEEGAWQFKLVQAFNESLAIRSEIKSLRRGHSRGRIPADLASPGVIEVRDTFEHDLGNLLAKAYDITGTKPGEARALLLKHVNKARFEPAARMIAERVRAKSPAIADSILVMIGDKEPELHERFREALHDVDKEDKKEGERALKRLRRTKK